MLSSGYPEVSLITGPLKRSTETAADRLPMDAKFLDRDSEAVLPMSWRGGLDRPREKSL